MKTTARLLAKLEVLGFIVNGNEAIRTVLEWDDVDYYNATYAYGIEGSQLVARFADGYIDRESTNTINKEIAKCHI